MDMLKEQMERILLDYDFELYYINDEKVYLNKKTGHYHCITYVKGLKSYVIESADNFEEAQKNRFEDSDVYPIAMGEKDLLKAFRKDIEKYYI